MFKLLLRRQILVKFVLFVARVFSEGLPVVCINKVLSAEGGQCDDDWVIIGAGPTLLNNITMLRR